MAPFGDLDARRAGGLPAAANRGARGARLGTVSVIYGSPETEASSREVLAKLSDAAGRLSGPASGNPGEDEGDC